jgi:hypothetical protein
MCQNGVSCSSLDAHVAPEQLDGVIARFSAFGVAIIAAVESMLAGVDLNDERINRYLGSLDPAGERSQVVAELDERGRRLVGLTLELKGSLGSVAECGRPDEELVAPTTGAECLPAIGIALRNHLMKVARKQPGVSHQLAINAKLSQGGKIIVPTPESMAESIRREQEQERALASMPPGLASLFAQMGVDPMTIPLSRR